MNNDNKITVEFAPGCFDDFEGTQAELDALIKEIQRMAESGELQENAQPLDILELQEHLDEHSATTPATHPNHRRRH